MTTLETTGELRLDENEKGVANISFDWNTSGVFNLANTEIAKSWYTVQLNWHYPHDDMTLIVETPFTQQRQPYAISLDNEELKRGTARVIRIIDGDETELNLDDGPIVVDCDCNYQVILKLYATPAAAYLCYIKYDVIKK